MSYNNQEKYIIVGRHKFDSDSGRTIAEIRGLGNTLVAVLSKHTLGEIVGGGYKIYKEIEVDIVEKKDARK